MGRLIRLAIPLFALCVLAAAGCGEGSDTDEGAAADGTEHGAQVAEDNCPDIGWQRVEASAFSFSVPADFVDRSPRGVDSEVGQWSGDTGLEVFYDYGWYSGSIASSPGAAVEPVDYSGITGTRTIVTGDPNQMQVFFDEVEVIDGQPNLLALNVNYEAAADEIVARCIVGSIEWNLG